MLSNLFKLCLNLVLFNILVMNEMCISLHHAEISTVSLEDSQKDILSFFGVPYENFLKNGTLSIQQFSFSKKILSAILYRIQKGLYESQTHTK
jgi:hypothetical protein